MTELVVSELDLTKQREVNEVAKLYVAAFRSSPISFVPDLEGFKREIGEWRKLKQTANAKILGVRTKDGKLVATSIGHKANPAVKDKFLDDLVSRLGGENHYFLREAAVDPEYRRRGLAQRLLELQIEHARKLNCGSIFGLVLHSNTPQRSQLVKNGFEHVFTKQHVVAKRGAVMPLELMCFRKHLHEEKQ